MPSRILRLASYAKAHVVEHHVPGDARGVQRALLLQDFRREGEHLAHAARAHTGLLQRAGGVRDRRQRAVDRSQVGDHHEQAAQRERAVQHVQPADDEDQRGAGQRDHRHPHREHRLLPREPQPRRHRLLADPAEAIQLVALAREALDGRDRRDDLEGAIEQHRLLRLHLLGAVGHGPRVVAQADVQERRHGQRQQRQRRRRAAAGSTNITVSVSAEVASGNTPPMIRSLTLYASASRR